MTEEAKKNYSFYLGCVIPNRYPMIERATRSVMDELGVNLIDMQGASCCPAPGVFRSFNAPTWLAMGARNITIAEQNKADIVTMCNGCYGTLGEVDHQMKSNKATRTEVNKELNKIGRDYKGSVKVRHVTEILYKAIGLEALKKKMKKKLNLKAAVHYGCHLLKPHHLRPWGGEFEDPRFFDELVELTGAKSIDYKDKLMCCGAGGGVRSIAKEVSLDFTKDKLMAMREKGVDIIVVACPFCHLQLDLGQIEINSIFKDEIGEPFNIPVVYITQLLGAAMDLPLETIGVESTGMKGVSPFVSIEPFAKMAKEAELID